MATQGVSHSLIWWPEGEETLTNPFPSQPGLNGQHNRGNQGRLHLIGKFQTSDVQIAQYVLHNTSLLSLVSACEFQWKRRLYPFL